MTNGLKEDWFNTKEQLKNPNPIKGGKTWLRHKEGAKAGTIDVMILEGRHTISDIADELYRSCPDKRSLATQVQFVKGHIEHLQSGEGWGDADGREPHYLKIRIDSNRRVMFDLK